MSYVTPTSLRDAVGVVELLQACAESDPNRLVDADLLTLTIDGGNRADYDAQSRAAADAMLVDIATACTQATSTIDGRLRSRWPALVLPIVSPSDDIKRIAQWIARYFVHDAIVDEQNSIIWRRYNVATTELASFSKGLTDLGVVPPTTVESTTGPIVKAPDEVFSNDVLESMP